MAKKKYFNLFHQRLSALWYYYVNCQQLCSEVMNPWAVWSLLGGGQPRPVQRPLGVQSLKHSAFVQDGHVQGFHGDWDAETQGSHQPSPFSSCQMSQTISTWSRWGTMGEGLRLPVEWNHLGSESCFPTDESWESHSPSLCTHASVSKVMAVIKKTHNSSLSLFCIGVLETTICRHPGKTDVAFWVRLDPSKQPREASSRNPLVGFWQRPPGRLQSGIDQRPPTGQQQCQDHQTTYLSDFPQPTCGPDL